MSDSSGGSRIPPAASGHSEDADVLHQDSAQVRRLPGREAEKERVARAVAGDKEAQRALLVAHMDRLRYLVTKLIGGGPDVDDLVQSTLVEAIRSFPRYRGDAPFRLWIERIATHVVYRFFRSNKRRRARIFLVEDPEAGHESVDEIRRVEWREAVREAREIIDSLKPEWRIIFLLVAVEGRTVDEAAALLDLSLPGAKSRFLRARRHVDKRIAERPALAATLARFRKGAEEEDEHG